MYIYVQAEINSDLAPYGSPKLFIILFYCFLYSYKTVMNI